MNLSTDFPKGREAIDQAQMAELAQLKRMEALEATWNNCGTRAPGTEHVIYRILQSPEYRTVEIISRLLVAVLIGPETPESLYVRASNVIDRIDKWGDVAIPKNEWDLVLSSDLAVTTIAHHHRRGTRAQAKIQAKAKPRRRKFQICLGCSKRFQVKRADTLTCGPKCRSRVARRTGVVAVVDATVSKIDLDKTA